MEINPSFQHTAGMKLLPFFLALTGPAFAKDRIFDITKFGATTDDDSDDTLAILKVRHSFCAIENIHRNTAWPWSACSLSYRFHFSQEELYQIAPVTDTKQWLHQHRCNHPKR